MMIEARHSIQAQHGHAGRHASAGSAGSRAVPPAYGIDFLDRQDGASCAAAPLRQLPGGQATRPLGAVPPPRMPAMPAAPIPPTVASAVGSFGTRLLCAAQGATRPESPPTITGTMGRSPAGGAPIPEQLRGRFERSFGYDLSAARVHTGRAAQRAAAGVGAAAFTLGDHIVLGGGLDLGSAAGQHVLGHELVHTVQSRLGGGRGRISEPHWPAEIEAERGALAALNGRRYEIVHGAGDDLQRIVPWLILAGIGLAAGLITWAASRDPEENRRRHADGEDDASRSLWALIPLYGSFQQIREAESYFQRVLGVGFMMLDFATLGSAGVAARALIRAPAALVRTAVARGAGTLVVREGGEIATEAAARETAALFGREGGVIMTSQSAATAEMLQALGRGSLLAVTEGGLNHAVIYARNAAGQLLRIHGGPLRVMFEVTGRELTSGGVSGLAQRANSYFIIEMGQATVSIEQAIGQAQRSWPAILRWLGGTPTSCGILQAAVIESAGLPAATLSRLLPAAGAAGRLVPITIMEHAAGRGALRLVEGGMARIIGGTLMQSASVLVGGVAPIMTTTLMRFLVNDAARDTFNQPVSGARGSDTDVYAQQIVRRFGATPAGPLNRLQEALAGIIPGWHIRSEEFRRSLAASLISAGMPGGLAEEIALHG